MARGKSRFKATEVKRAVAAVIAAGLRVRGVDMRSDGFTVLCNSLDAARQPAAVNDLDHELAEFEARNELTGARNAS